MNISSWIALVSVVALMIWTAVTIFGGPDMEDE